MIGMDGKTWSDESSGGGGPEDPTDADAAETHPASPRRWAPEPVWLHPSDLEALAQRFAPLDLEQAHHLALLLVEGSTPVEILIFRLVSSGLAPWDARRFIAELRALREQARRPADPRPTNPGSEFASALKAAATSYVLKPDDDEQAARAIMRQVQWSIVRARWFMSVNREKVRRMADSLTEQPEDN
jgi:hypothetical protein